MQLPSPIEAYFAADRGTDRAALTSSFAMDAVVKDERTAHTGHEEILAWRLSSTEKYADLVTEPIEQIVDGDRVIVRCKVSGDSPTAPSCWTSPSRSLTTRSACWRFTDGQLS